MRMNRNFGNAVITVSLGIWVLALAGFKGRQYLLDRASAKTNDAGISANWQKLILGLVPVLGTPTARFKIVEFSDYQCPFCALADIQLAKFVGRHPGEVAVYRHDMPLQNIHLYAYAAALAANCAELQGLREPYQSLLFQHQKEFASLDWIALARRAGIKNGSSFEQCVRDSTPSGHIRKDIEMGKSMGIESTPSFLINGTSLSGGFSADRLESLYEETHRTNLGWLHSLLESSRETGNRAR